MPKGLFTGSIVLLADEVPDLDDVGAALTSFTLVGSTPGDSEQAARWIGGASIVLSMDGPAAGKVAVDVVDAPWPDSMGDPQEAPELFGAWGLGAFGPFVFPGNLERAAAHAIRWDDAPSVAERHRGFVRVRSSYTLGGSPDDPVLPEGYDAATELSFLTKVARTLLDVSGITAWFDPSGEILLAAEHVDRSLAHAGDNQIPPLDLWSNVRFFRIGDAEGWGLMDTVGMEQLGVRDQEACFPIDRFDPNVVAPFLRNVSLYLLNHGPVIEAGHTIDGPGGVWRAALAEQSLVPAPRPTLRWYPADVEVPAAFV